MTTFDQYQAQCATTAVYPDRGTGSPTALAYVALGLGEVGEVQDKVADLLAGGRDEDLGPSPSTTTR